MGGFRVSLFPIDVWYPMWLGQSATWPLSCEPRFEVLIQFQMCRNARRTQGSEPFSLGPSITCKTAEVRPRIFPQASPQPQSLLMWREPPSNAGEIAIWGSVGAVSGSVCRLQWHFLVIGVGRKWDTDLISPWLRYWNFPKE